jgi:hypothetical protein
MPSGERRAAIRKLDAGDTIMTSTRCPTREEIIRLFEGRLPADGEKRLLDHIPGCADCRTVYEPLAEIESRSEAILAGLEGVNLESPETRAKLQALARRELRAMRTGRRAGVWTRRWLAVPAAGAVLALLVAFVVLSGLRTGPAPVAERNAGGIEIGLVQMKPTSSSSPVDFHWTGLPSVRAYRLDVYDQTLEPVHRSLSLTDTRYTLPAEAAAAMEKRAVYFWKVTATLEDGRTVESEFGKLLFQK